jgi:hypothetical protein
MLNFLEKNHYIPFYSLSLIIYTARNTSCVLLINAARSTDAIVGHSKAEDAILTQLVNKQEER